MEMKQQILSTALALCMCMSAVPNAHAWQETPLQQENFLAAESTIKMVPYEDVKIPTLQEAYSAMIALKEQDMYKEGTEWTDYIPYNDNNLYRWKGGPINGKNIVAVGCVAFAFSLSDAAFGSLPARTPGYSFENVKVGDILRMNTDTHTVIVLEVNEAGVVVAEGNLSGKVHWGRAISKEELQRDVSTYITRYPEGYIPPDDPTANDPFDENSSGKIGSLA